MNRQRVGRVKGGLSKPEERKLGKEKKKGTRRRLHDQKKKKPSLIFNQTKKSIGCRIVRNENGGLGKVRRRKSREFLMSARVNLAPQKLQDDSVGAAAANRNQVNRKR